MPQDFAEALKLFRFAADKGDARAQFNLGYMYAWGEGVPQSDDARTWYELAAKQGLADAQHNLGGLHEKAGNHTEAFRWYERAAKQGHPNAQAGVGFAYSKGRGISQDRVEARKWYQLAAEQGVAIAQCNLGMLFENDEDYASAARWYRCSAEQGYAQAQQNLANFYFLGNGLPKNDEEAVKWYRLAAEQDHPLAQLNLGVMHHEGFGVAKDVDLARLWFSLAGAHGVEQARKNFCLSKPVDLELDALVGKAIGADVESQRNLAIRLHYADAAPHDRAAAMVFLRRAAEGGDPWAQTTLAIELRNTKKPDKEEESVRWLLKAAEQRDARARLTLGLQQSLGVGTPVDLESAAVNMIMASLAGFEGAKDLAATLIAELPETTRARVIERVKWADIILILGPLVPGHHDPGREWRESDDESENARWIEYERETADILFKGKAQDSDSILTTVFGEKVAIRKFSVARADVRGKRVAATTISLRDSILGDEFPVYWEPDDQAVSALATLLGALALRDWVEWLYVKY